MRRTLASIVEPIHLTKEDFLTFMKSYDEQQIFSLCKELENLNLSDSCSTSSNSNTSWLNSLRESLNLPFIPTSPEFMKKLDKEYAKFIPTSQKFMNDLNEEYAELEESPLKHLKIAFVCNYYPVKRLFRETIEHRIQTCDLPRFYDKLYLISSSLGLSYTRRNLPDMVNERPQTGNLINQISTKFMVNMVTYHSGLYGRFLVLVMLGIGVTVWYNFTPGLLDEIPTGPGFQPMPGGYEPFYNPEYEHPDLKKIHLKECSDSLVNNVMSSYMKDIPFKEINLPPTAVGVALPAVSLGIMVAIFLSLGIVPNASMMSQ